jgi:Predicted membrane protein (DUF2306)
MNIIIKILLLGWWVGSIFFIYYIISEYLSTVFNMDYRWDQILPGLGWPIGNRIYIGLHFFFGIIIQFIGPIQFIERLRTLHIHKWTGRTYIVSCLITAACGIAFIIMNGTVGKFNMTVSFTLYGIFLYISAAQTWIYARQHDYQNHMYWAIRTFALGTGSWIYRLLYYSAFICGYTFDDHSDFLRPLDMLFDWLFFVPNMICAEIIICLLKKKFF